MDFSFIDGSFSNSSAFAASSSQSVQDYDQDLDTVDLCRTTVARRIESNDMFTTSIYPSLGHLSHANRQSTSSTSDFEITKAYNLSDEELGALENVDINANNIGEDDTMTYGLELDTVKHKISSIWNNVKYGWSVYLKRPKKMNLDKNEPTYVLGKCFLEESVPIQKTADDYANFDVHETSYDDSMLKYDYQAPAETPFREKPIYSLRNDQIKRSSPWNIKNPSFFESIGFSPKKVSSYPMTKRSISQPGSSVSLARSMTSDSMKTNLDKEIYSRIWFTYRKDFEPIRGNNTKYTSDCGWGCMLRSAQMLIAQGLLYHFFKRNWSLYTSLRSEQDINLYRQVLVWFNDRPSDQCPFGIHKLLEISDMRVNSKSNSNDKSLASSSSSPGATDSLDSTDTKQNSRVGSWFGPTSVCILMKDALNEALKANPLLRQIRIYCAQDCTIYKQDILDMCTQKVVDKDDVSNTNSEANEFLPCIILVSVRLGGEELNDIYTPSLKKFLSMPNCIGLIGGKPKHSLYFIGYQGNKVIYLDPHISQPTIELHQVNGTNRAANSKKSEKSRLDFSFEDTSDESSVFNNSSFHCLHANKTAFSKLDPSLAIGFYCGSAKELDDLCEEIQKMSCSEDCYPIFGISDTTFEKAQIQFRAFCDDDSNLNITSEKVKVNDQSSTSRQPNQVSSEQNGHRNLAVSSSSTSSSSLNRLKKFPSKLASTALSSQSNSSSVSTAKSKQKKDEADDSFVLI